MQSRLIWNARVLTALVMFLIFTAMTILALDFPEKARLMPLMIGIPGSIMSFIQLLLEYRLAAKEQAEFVPSDEKQQESRDEQHMFIWLFVFFIGILGFGFLYAAPLIVFAFLYKYKKETIQISIISAVTTWLVLYGAFQKGFELRLFEGLVVRWIIG